MKTSILILILTTSITAQTTKISQETYDGLIERQFKPIPIYNGPVFIIINKNVDISEAGWNWPINSTNNIYLGVGYDYFTRYGNYRQYRLRQRTIRLERTTWDKLFSGKRSK